MQKGDICGVSRKDVFCLLLVYLLYQSVSGSPPQHPDYITDKKEQQFPLSNNNENTMKCLVYSSI